MTTPIDTLWVLVCALLVFLMQLGFACFEVGMVRSKNTINVVMKNILDFGVSAGVFWLFGFGFMFGPSIAGWMGVGGFAPDSWSGPDVSVFFLFQLMFCGTAVTILSGAAAERMKLLGYLASAAVVAGLAYPVFGHWAWGKDGWLGALGFVDFAGSTVVHSVGGWAAVAVLLVIGPRTGRFDGDGRIEPHSLVFTMLGTMLVWFGWFGFNSGSGLAFDDRVPGVLVNTLLAPVGAMIAAIALIAEIDLARSREVYAVLLAAAEMEGY